MNVFRTVISAGRLRLYISFSYGDYKRLVGRSGVNRLRRKVHSRLEEGHARIVIVVGGGFDRRFSDIFVIQRDCKMVCMECSQKVSSGDQGVRCKQLTV